MKPCLSYKDSHVTRKILEQETFCFIDDDKSEFAEKIVFSF